MGDKNSPFTVTDSVLKKPQSRCVDIVYLRCQHSLCITKSYGRYLHGTGSVLSIRPRREVDPDESTPEKAEVGDQSPNGMLSYRDSLRFLTPAEVFRLMGFPSRFGLPRDASVTNRVVWALAGNSLNPVVVGEIFKEHGQRVRDAIFLRGARRESRRDR